MGVVRAAGRNYFDMPVDAGAGAGAGCLSAQPAMVSAAIARAMMVMCFIVLLVSLLSLPVGKSRDDGEPRRFRKRQLTTRLARVARRGVKAARVR